MAKTGDGDDGQAANAGCMGLIAENEARHDVLTPPALSGRAGPEGRGGQPIAGADEVPRLPRQEILTRTVDHALHAGALATALGRGLEAGQQAVLSQRAP